MKEFPNKGKLARITPSRSFAKGGLRISKKRERVVFKLVPKKTTEVINCQINRLSTTFTTKWNVTCLQINRNLILSSEMLLLCYNNSFSKFCQVQVNLM